MSVFLLCVGFISNAQVGREFWFVAPEVTNAHGDSPVVFRITTYDVGTNVTISSPANTSFNTVNVYIGPNTQYTVNDYNYAQDVLDNRPSNQVNNKGILITAHDADISVYYEIVNGNNPDKFTLKGANGLGTEFFVPSQNIYINQTYTPKASEKVDLVATTDDTNIVFIPTADVVGYSAGDTIEISLDRGQTFCVENTNTIQGSSLAGSYISSNNPIAVTISDDSINEDKNGGGSWDLIGDQLIPTSVIGFNYVVVNTAPNGHNKTINKVFVLATEDNTTITLNGNTNLVTTLNKGQQISIDITQHNMYIEGTKPIYVYQLSSLDYGSSKSNELGSALIPHAECTGSDMVSFTRIFTNHFFLQLLVKGADKDNFTIKDENGNVLSDFFKNTVWNKVEGSGDGDEQWFTCNIDLSSSISTNQPYYIANSTGLFHLSVLEENGTSASYGYFSSFSNLTISGLTEACYGNVLKLTTDEEMLNYQWFSDQSSGIVSDPTQRSIDVNQSGKYWVQAEMAFGGCELVDTIDVVFNRPVIDLGNDTTVCPGSILDFAGEEASYTYNWSNGANTINTSVTVTELYDNDLSVLVTDAEGCSNGDTINIKAFLLSEINLDFDTVCIGQAVTVVNTFSEYEWSLNGNILNTDPTQNYLIPSISGTYTVTCLTSNGCEVTKNFDIVVNQLPIVDLKDETTCLGESILVDGPTGIGYSYLWNDGSTNSTNELTTEGTFWLEVTDANGCIGRDEAELSFTIPVPIDLGPDRVECDQALLAVSDYQNYNNFKWFFIDGAVETEVIGNPTEYQYLVLKTDGSTEGQYKVEAEDANGCPVKDSVNVSFIHVPVPTLTLSQNLCANDTVTLTASTGYNAYKWFKDGIEQTQFTDLSSIEISEPGQYTVEVTLSQCSASNNIDVQLYGLPTVELKDGNIICPGGETTLAIANYTQSSSGGGLDYLYWETNDNVRFTDWSSAKYTVDQVGQYTVTVVDKFGCISTDQVDVTQHTLLSINLTESSICEDETITLQNPLTNAQSYEWYQLVSGSEIKVAENNDYIVSGLNSGVYSYKLTLLDANGCENSDTVDITINATPSFILNDATVCPNINHSFDGPAGAYQYLWSDGSTNQSLVTSNTGQYTLQVTDANGCLASESASLSNYSPIPINLGPDRQECAGIDLTLTASSSHSNYTWELDGNVLVSQLPEYKYLISNGQVSDNGTYRVVAEDINGCVVEDEVVVNIYNTDPPSLEVTENLCKNESIEIIASTGYDSYTWFYNGAPITSALNEDTIRIDKPGFYLVQATYNACVKFNEITVDEFSLPNVQLPVDFGFCQGGEAIIDGVQFQVSTDGSNFDYLYWGKDSTTRYDDWQNVSYTVSTAGTYSVTVVDEIGCKATDEIEISEFAVTPPELNGPFTACNDIGVTLQNTATNSTSYSWFKVVSGMDINVANDVDYLVNTSGTYKLEVVDANGCESKDSVEITINSVPEFKLDDAIVCPGITHRFEDINLNVANYDYLWSDNSTNSYLETNLAGTYSLQVTDKNTLCSSVESVELSNYTPVTFKLGNDLSACVETDLTITAPSSFFNYIWKYNDGSNPEVTLVNQNPENKYQIINAQVSHSGDYIVEANDVNGCSVSDGLNVEIYDIDIPELELSKYLCEDEKATIIATAGYDSYEWYGNGLLLSSNQNLEIDEAGLYALITTYRQCVRANDINVTEYSKPSVQLPNAYSICPGEQDELRVASYSGSPFDYLYWNDATNQRYSSWQTAKYHVTIPSEYSVTVVDTLGCAASATIQISENSVTPLNLPESYTSCLNTGQMLTHNETNYQTYYWYKLNKNGEQLLETDNDYLATEPGSYKLQLVDLNGCQKSDTTVLILNQFPDIDLGDDRTACEMEYLVITAQGDFVSYKWNDDASLNTNKLLVTSAGKYKVEVTNTVGCLAADSVEINVQSAPQLDLGPDVTLCPGLTHPLSAPAGYSYLWSNGSVDQNIELEDGKHTLKITDSNGCSSTDTVTVNYFPQVVVDLGEDEYICPVLGTIELDAGDFVTYEWQNGEVTRTIRGEISDTVNIVNVVDANGCRGFDTKMVKYLSEPEIELLNDTSICSVDSLLLSVDWSNNNIQWSTGEQYPEIWVSNPGIYSVLANDGCFYLADTMEMIVVPTPFIASLDTSIYAQVVLFPEGGTEPYQYSINDGFYQNDNVFKNLENGEYIFNVMDVNGCMVSEIVNINDNLDLEIPKFITPNGDGYNDTWEITGLDRLPESIISIYDRYGKLLLKYSATDPGWDGKYLGKPMKSDDYWYVIELVPLGKHLKGNLTLKR